MSARAWSLLVVLSFLWGGSFLFNRLAVAELPTLTIVLVRVGLAAAILLAVLAASGGSLPRTRRDGIDFLVMGLLSNAVPFGLIVWGQQHIAAGLASILNATTPIFAVVLTHLFTTDDKATPLKLAGVVMGLVGVAVLVGFDRFAGFGTELLAELACLAAALCYGLATVWSRRFRGRPPVATAAGQLLASSAILLVPTLLIDRPWTLAAPGATALLAVAGLAVLSTAVAYVIFFRIISLAGATSAMLVTLLVPPSAILLGALVLGERLAPQHFAGMAVIACGLVLIDGRAPRALRTALVR